MNTIFYWGNGTANQFKVIKANQKGELDFTNASWLTSKQLKSNYPYSMKQARLFMV